MDRARWTQWVEMKCIFWVLSCCVRWWWCRLENKGRSRDLCVEVSATLGLIELLSQSDPLLVYCTSHTHIKFKSAHWRMSHEPTYLPTSNWLNPEEKESKLTKKSKKKDKIQAVDAFHKEYLSLIGKSSKVDTPMSLPQQTSQCPSPARLLDGLCLLFMMIFIYIALCLAQNFIPPCQIQGSCWMTRTLGLTIRLHPTSRCHYGVLFSGWRFRDKKF